jgi:hypothetical protein
VGRRKNKEGNQKFPGNESTTYENLWDIAKAALGGKFIAMSAYIKRTERSQINDLMLHLKLLEKIRISQTPNKQKDRNNKNEGRN